MCVTVCLVAGRRAKAGGMGNGRGREWERGWLVEWIGEAKPQVEPRRDRHARVYFDHVFRVIGSKVVDRCSCSEHNRPNLYS